MLKNLKILFAGLIRKNKLLFFTLQISYLAISFLELLNGLILSSVFVNTENSKNITLLNNFINKINIYFNDTFSNNSLLIIIIFVFLFTSILNIILNYINLFFSNFVGHSLSKKMLRSYFDENLNKIRDKELNYFNKQINFETQRVSGIYNSLLNMNSKIILSLILLGFIFVQNIYLSLIFLFILIIFYSIFYILFKKFYYKTGKKYSEIFNTKTGATFDLFQGIREFKIYNKENMLFKSFNKASIKYVQLRSLVKSSQILPRQIIEFSIFVTLVIYFLNTNNSDTQFSTNLPMVVFLGFAGLKMLPAFQIIYSGISNFNEHSHAINSLKKFFLENKNFYSKNRDTKLNFTRDIRLKINSFSYDTKKILFDDTELKISKDCITCLVSQSGIGKSTALDILTSLIYDKEIKYYLDGTELSNDFQNLSDYKNLFSYCTQYPFMLNDNVKTNIIFGKEFDKNLYEQALDIAKIDFDNVVLNSNSLSGGQKQRVSIARSIYHKKEILILDEATNAISNEMQKEIIEKLKNIFSTIIISTHDKSLQNICDKMFEIQNKKFIKTK